MSLSVLRTDLIKYTNLMLFTAAVTGMMYLQAENPVVFIPQQGQTLVENHEELNGLYKRVVEQTQKYKDRYDLQALKNSNGFEIHMAMGTLFKPGKADFDYYQEKYLFKYITDLRLQTQPVLVEVEGHSDPSPITNPNTIYSNNWEISAVRASFIGQLFVKAGLSPENLKVVGRGSSQPLKFSEREIASVSDYDRIAKQRRVVIYITPQTIK